MMKREILSILSAEDICQMQCREEKAGLSWAAKCIFNLNIILRGKLDHIYAQFQGEPVSAVSRAGGQGGEGKEGCSTKH